MESQRTMREQYKRFFNWYSQIHWNGFALGNIQDWNDPMHDQYKLEYINIFCRRRVLRQANVLRYFTLNGT